MTDALLEARSCLRIGRQRALHLPRVLIEGQAVILRTRCGLDPLPDGFTESYGVPTCEACIESEAAA